MSTEENKAAERRFNEEVWVKHNLSVVDELVAADVVEHNPLFPGHGPGREGFKQTLKTVFSAVAVHRFTPRRAVGAARLTQQLPQQRVQL